MAPTALTFGCRLNAAESLTMISRAGEAGLDDAILVNTCAVTAEAVRQARQAIRRARRAHPDRRIVVAGCAAQTQPELFAAMPEVDLVLGNAEKLRAESYRLFEATSLSHAEALLPSAVVIAGLDPAIHSVAAGDFTHDHNPDVVMPGLDLPSPKRSSGFAQAGPGIHSVTAAVARARSGMDRRVKPGDDDGGWDQATPLPGKAASGKIRVGDIFAPQNTTPLPDAVSDLPRAYVQVQNGCDHRCTFCVIPYGRGNSRSVPMGAVVESVRRHVARGVAEVVLTGIDITSYGADLPGAPRLGTLVRKVLKHVPALPRLRLSSIDSVEADDELLRAIAEEERLMPHLHLSLQAGDDIILKRMKRRHSRADAIRFADAVRRRRPDIVLGADLIAGFPTESDAMFMRTLSLIDECGLTLLHVFPFSPRPGTPAARMPQLNPAVVQERARAVRQKGNGALSARLSAEVGKVRTVLVEKPGLGRTAHYLPVAFEGGTAGELFSARIAAASDKRLSAHEIRAAA